MSKLPSPCLGVCKFRRQGHCIACSMTKAQKSVSKKLKKPREQEAFIELLLHQQKSLGNYPAWPRAYLKRCEKKGKIPPEIVQAGR